MIVGALLVMMLLYKFYAVPVGIVFSFFVARSLVRKRSSIAAMGITLVWTLAIFTPLRLPSQMFFNDIYVPWYAALMMAPPAPGFSPAALAVTFVVALMSSAVAVVFARGHRS